MFDIFPFVTGLSHNCPHIPTRLTCPTRPTCPTCPTRLTRPTSPTGPTSLTCPTRPTCPTSPTSLPVRLALPLALPQKIFSLLLHYTYDIQTIQEERTKSEKSAKYKHLIKVPKVVCFTFQLF